MKRFPVSRTLVTNLLILVCFLNHGKADSIPPESDSLHHEPPMTNLTQEKNIITSVNRKDITGKPPTKAQEEEEKWRRESIDTISEIVRSTLNKNDNYDYGDYNDRATTETPAIEKWIKFANFSRELFGEIFRKILPQLLRMSYDFDISTECSASLLQTFFALKDEKLWAFKFIDAIGRIPPGLLEGSAVGLGNYDECLSISVKEEDGYSDGELFRGKYCRAEYSFPAPSEIDPRRINMKTKFFNFENTTLKGTYLERLGDFAHLTYEAPLRLGVCIPSTCSEKDLQSIVDTVLRRFSVEGVKISSCDTQEPLIMTNGQKAIIGYFSSFIILVVVATGLDVFLRLKRNKEGKEHPKGKFAECILCFSAYTNTLKLVDTKVSDPRLASLNGIRVLSTLWIILGHCYLFNTKVIYNSTSRFITVVDGLPFQAIMNAFVLVDSFFFMGALVATIGHLDMLKKTNGRGNAFLLILYRILRFLPTLSFVVAFVLVWPLLSSGPYWPDIVTREAIKCQRSWWKTLLFFNNWLDIYDMCLIHTWYLSADIQLFIVFLFVPVVIYRWPKKGLILTGCLCLFGIISTVVSPVIEDVEPVILYNTPIETHIAYVARRTHFRTYTHFQSYAIGIFVAYIFHKGRKIPLKPIYQVVAWTFSLLFVAAVLLGTYKWNRGEPLTPLPALLYAGTSRLAWSLALAWLVYACAVGKAGILNKFLSWSFFVPLARLCFQIYLIHLLVIWTRFAMLRERLNFTHFETVCESMVVCGISVGAAFVLNLIVEAPTCRLTKLLLNPKKEYRTDEKQSEKPPLDSTLPNGSCHL